MRAKTTALIVVTLVVTTIGCTAAPPAIRIHAEPGQIIEVAFDPHAGSGHSHPATVSLAQMAAALKGLNIRERDTITGLGIFEDDSIPALSERTINVLASYLVSGLTKASPRDLVTFFLAHRENLRAPLITSGGVFVRNQHLYVILANARSSLSGNQYETPYPPDAKSEPMLPITRFKFAVSFVPSALRIPTAEAKKRDDWAGYLDESKVIVLDLASLASTEMPPSLLPSNATQGSKP